MSAKFEKHSLKTVRALDYTNSILYNAKKLPKFKKALIWSKLIPAPSIPTCTSSICPQDACKVWETFTENCGRSWLHKLHNQHCKNCLKKLISKGRNSIKINSSAIVNLQIYMHILIMSTTSMHSFKTIHWKLKEEYITNFRPYYAKKLPKMTKFERP